MRSRGRGAGDAEPDGSRLPRACNAGIWCVGRLQTDADRARVIEGLANAGAVDEGLDAESLDATVKKLSRGCDGSRVGEAAGHPRSRSTAESPSTRVTW